MSGNYRVVKVSYSEELPSDSEIWLERFIEKSLLDHIAKKDGKLHSLLINKK